MYLKTYLTFHLHLLAARHFTTLYLEAIAQGQSNINLLFLTLYVQTKVIIKYKSSLCVLCRLKAERVIVKSILFLNVTFFWRKKHFFPGKHFMGLKTVIIQMSLEIF